MKLSSPQRIFWPVTLLSLSVGVGASLLLASRSSQAAAVPTEPPALRGLFYARSTFPNPHSHIPAQCYTETSFGTQNACQACHTNGVARLKLGNNNPQAGDNPMVGSMQTVYGFGVYDYPQVVNSSINPWENTLRPEVLRRAVADIGEKPERWDMLSYIRQDNWTPAFAKRPNQKPVWDTGVNSPFRLFPSLSPADLPAQADGFVRTNSKERAIFADDRGGITGWRAINFMPYGIFTPMTGSVSGVYIRLPQSFMQNDKGEFDRAVYEKNLELVTANVQDRLAAAPTQTHYTGAAQKVAIVRGQYPLGTEFAHPLHYVDLAAEGTRSKRVKEIRWMYKMHEWHMDEFGNALKEESAPVYANDEQGWIENGTGWILGGWIEDQAGHLRAQTPAELTQCVGCHSGNTRQSDIGQNAIFTSGTGNTIDSTWAMPRKFSGAAGWREMDYLGYSPKDGTLSIPEPKNRMAGVGEYRLFLDRVVGASLYGDMPPRMDAFFAAKITKKRGYSDNWPTLKEVIAGNDAEGIKAAQELRQKLMRELTARGEHLQNGSIHPELLLPTQEEALATAARYRQVVVTQRYDFGKDVFEHTPFTLRYFRTKETAYTHQDGTPYKLGEIITDRPVDEDPPSFTYGIGITDTLIPEEGPESHTDYVPLLE